MSIRKSDLKIVNMLEELKLADKSAQMICLVPHADIKSRIYIVCQLQENIPGMNLGNREPYLREKILEDFIDELKTFGENFSDNNFLLQYQFFVNDKNYEFRYYELTTIEFEDGEVVLKSNSPELENLRTTHQLSDY